jgi:2-keto-3-deoxy-L-rhamnonate aldolase RhmA
MPKSLFAQNANERINAMYPQGGPGRYLKNRLKNGDLLVGATLTEYARPSLIKIYQQAGFDFVYIEYEHAYFDMTRFSDTVLSARDNGLPVIAKTPDLERQEVAKLLESGVVGIQLPRTEHKHQVEELLSYIKYPPSGTRAAASGYGNSDYLKPTHRSQWLKDQNDETTLVVHIETNLGCENAEEIINVPGVDMVYIGLGDLSIEMGYPDDKNHPAIVEMMSHLLNLCKKKNIPMGTTSSDTTQARFWIERGVKFFEGPHEMEFIQESSSNFVESYRKIED